MIASQNTQNLDKTNDTSDFKKIVVLPFIEGFDRCLYRIFNKQNVQLIFSIENNLKKLFFKSTKDITMKDDKFYCIYKHKCQNCQKTYYGQTRRALRIRNREHGKSIGKNDTNTATAKHAYDFSHNFEFNLQNVKIMEIELNLKKRLILEITYIQNDKNSINFRTDIQGLSDIYSDLVSNIHKF